MQPPRAGTHRLLAWTVALAFAACGGGSSTPAIPDAAVADASTAIELLFRVHVPDNTPAGADVFIAGNFQGWDPAATRLAPSATDAKTYEITLAFEPGTQLEFKLTRGSWDTVEKGTHGEEVPNRVLEVVVASTVDVSVSAWADSVSTITGDVTTLSIPSFLGGRRVWLYLPPGYHTATDRYPVLYMLDGQNVFDRATSFVGEWKVDETLESIIPAGKVQPLIVVAVDNAGSRRIDEYTPWVDPSQGGAGGAAAAHLAAIADVLVPYIDGHYRTQTGADRRGIGGSSLGGLFALYATYARPDVFGRNAAFSPSIWWDGDQIVSYASAAPSRPAATVWMDMGTAEYAAAIGDLHAMRDAMVAGGFVLDRTLAVYEDEGAGHNETAWARRFPLAVEFLFPPP